MGAIDKLAPFIDARSDRYAELSDRIWSLAELRYDEHKSAELHIAMLEDVYKRQHSHCPHFALLPRRADCPWYRNVDPHRPRKPARPALGRARRT